MLLINQLITYQRKSNEKYFSAVFTYSSWRFDLYDHHQINLGGARDVMIIVVGNGHGDTSSNLEETDCISHSTNTLGKGMNPIILPPAMGK